VNSVFSNATTPEVRSSLTGCDGGSTEDSVSNTSWMRSAQTAARGAMISRKVAIITDIKI